VSACCARAMCRRRTQCTAQCSCLEWPQALSGVLLLTATVIYWNGVERFFSLVALGRAARNGST
jgi:hypothetical protein